MTIWIVDDHKLFRESLAVLLRGFENFQVTNMKDGAVDLFEALRQEQPEILILDIQLQGVSGVEICKQVRVEYPDIKVLMLSMFASAEMVSQVINSGAHGYITKQVEPRHLREAIEALHESEFYLDQTLGAYLKDAISATKPEASEKSSRLKLTEREIEIIKMAANELNNKEIGLKLFISERTVETHRRHIIEKLGAKNFLGVLTKSLQNNIVTLKDLIKKSG